MANQEMVTKQMEIAGYEEVTFDRVDAELMVGDSIEDAINFQLALGPAGEIYREAGELAERQQTEIVAALSDALSPYQREEGVVMGSSSWVITGRNPG